MFEGRVVRGTFAAGSKSGHEAVFLDTGQERLLLRLVGGNPFSDPGLDALVGKRIRGDGQVLAGHTLLLESWDEVP